MADDPKTRPVITLQRGHHKRAEAGHPWVYSNEVTMDAAAKALPPGTLVSLKNAGGDPLGVATFNPHTLVSARILDRNLKQRIDRDFFIARLEAALALRRRLYDEPYYRLIHAEADGLPGFVLDRYGEALVVQLNTAGAALLEEPLLVAAAEAVLAPRLIVLRNDSAGRALEGLAPELRIARGESDAPIELVENGARFLVDLREGQKTGWFFDQRDNRRFVAGLAAGARVLDLYCYGGGFAVQAARAGATAVLGARPLRAGAGARRPIGRAQRCRRALPLPARRGLRGAAAPCRCRRALRPRHRRSAGFRALEEGLGPGLRGYRKLARLAAGAGHAGRPPLYRLLLAQRRRRPTSPRAVRHGLEDAHRTGRILRSAGAAPDHPVHPWLPESAYLKAQVLVLD